MNKEGFLNRKTIIWTVLCMVIGFYISYSIFVSPQKESILQKVPVAVHQLSDIKNVFKKMVSKDIVVDSLKGKKELITMEAQMNDTITWDDSWGSLDIFKKLQRIHFFGTGIYVVDLSGLKSENVIVDNNKKVVDVTVSGPTIKSVTLDEEKTTYEAVEKGLLRFGDIKLLPEEHQIILQEIKNKMTEKMRESDMYEQALKNSEDSIKDIIQSVVSGQTRQNYTVNIHFEGSNIQAAN
jgi:hypothetical protein